MVNDVTFQRAEYANSLDAWNLVDDVVAGQKAVKLRRTTYLPQPNPDDKSIENQTRYAQYLARAVFYNATGRTLQGLVGAAFRKDPQVTIPGALDYVGDDIDGAGISIYQQSQESLKGVLKIGRHGLLVDYPRNEGAVSLAEMKKGFLRSTVLSISAKSIINWRTEKVGAVHKLVLLVIEECSQNVTEDGFGIKEEKQYRVLRLTDNIYTQEVWTKVKDKDLWEITWGPYSILDGSGSPWNEIPFTFIGANNNDTFVDPSPLYDMAEINIAHYRNSADYEDSAYFVGQAQPWMSGLSEAWRDHLEKKGIYVGSRAPILLPENGQFGIAQAEPNTMVREAMRDKEAQMIALGARLIQPGSAVKTATEAQGEQEAEHSVLSLACANVSEAYTKCLEWQMQFMNVSGESYYQINQDFVEHRLDAQLLTALISAWQSGRLPESDFNNQLRKYGLIDPEKDDETIKEELDSQDKGLNLDGNIAAVN